MKRKMEIIPAIDIIDGESVRLSQGDYNKKSSYYKDPLEVALRFEGVGLKRLHIVDLDGAKASQPKNLAVLERIASRTSLDIQFGGGIKNEQSLQNVLDSGANRAICGSIAVTQPDKFREWLALFGADRIVLGADTKNGKIAINGWLDESEIGVEQLIESFLPMGLKYVICTDIEQDGMLSGPSIPLYVELAKRFPSVETTVSGGVSGWADIEEVEKAGLKSVIVGKAIYEGRITFEMLERWAKRE